MVYLKDEQYYTDLYDLLTIKECLEWEKNIQEKDLSDYNKKKIPKKKQEPLKKFFTDLPLYFIKGERYMNKTERIREWIDKDRIKQEKYDNSPEPTDVYCLSCGNKMHSTSKELYDFTDEPLRVLFFFECSNCKKRRGVFDTGEEFKSHKRTCPECQSIVKITISKKGRKTIWTTKCANCDYKDIEIDDYDDWKKQHDDLERENEKLLLEYREKYCLSEKEGQEYILSKDSLNRMHEIIEKSKKEEADPAYQHAKKLKKISIVELEKLLNEALEKKQYVKLTLDKPEMGQYVIVPFTVQDADSSRKEYDSKHSLQKVIKKVLEETNWRLMSEGTSFRLGYVYGRLKGYEREDDMANLFRTKSSEKTSNAIHSFGKGL